MDAAADGAKKGVEDVGKGAGKAAQGAAELTSSMGSLVSAAAGLAMARQMIGGIAEACQEAYQFASKSAEEIIKIRDSVRELRGLGGDDKTSDDVIMDLMELRAKTGLKQTEAREFSEQFDSGIPTARDKGFLGPAGPARDALEEGIKEETALYAQRMGIGLKDAGVFASAILTAGPVKTREEFATKLARATQGAIDGQGNLTPFAKAGARAIAELGSEDGKVGNPEDVMALLGVTSVATGNSPLKAATFLSQAVAGLTGFNKTQGGFLKDQARILPTDDVMTMLGKMEPILKGADESGEGAEYFLQQHGFGERREVAAIAFLARNLDVARARVKRNHEGNFAADASEQNQGFLRTKEGQNRLAEVRADLGKQAVGLGKEAYTSAFKAAEGELWNEGELDTAETNANDFIWDTITWPLRKAGSGVDHRQMRVRQRMMADLADRGEAVGMDMGRYRRMGFGEISDMGEEQMAALFAKVTAEIQARQGNAIVDPQKMITVLEQIRDKMDGAPGRPPVPAARGPRPALPARPGA